MSKPKLVQLFILLSFVYVEIEANIFIDGIYCGQRNCYEVLGVTRQATKSEISKTYRALAKKHHPDKARSTEDKATAEEIFKQIANAYEILRDEESRNEYNDMLDNPDQFYQHYYRYYRRRVVKVDVSLVIGVTIVVISVIQYFVAHSRYQEAIYQLSTITKYRNNALELAQDEGLFDPNKKVKGKSKSDLKAEKEEIILKVLAENLDIRGGYAKPSILDILAIQLVILPYTFYKYVHWYARWVYKFDICKEEYGEEEKYYLIRKHLKYSQGQFDALEEYEKADLYKQELWKKDKYEIYRTKKEEERRIKMAGNNRLKQYRRYMKNHGPGRMTFED
ncbi:hypothetical protein WDU94_001712 [Cyamophila willieti]